MNRAEISMENTETPAWHRPDKVLFLYLAVDPKIRKVEYVPYFYAEVRIDFNDVRTGLKGTFSLNQAMEIYLPAADLLWSKDMVLDVNPENVVPTAPEGAHFGGLPDYVDANYIPRMETHFVQYLLRSFSIRLYRNSVLNLYSNSGENRSEFIERCRELFDAPRRRELDGLHDVYRRRLEQLKEKYLALGELIGLETAQIESQNRDIYVRYSDCIAELFLFGQFTSVRSTRPFHISPGMQELEERLMALGIEAQQSVTNLAHSYEDKARALDECILHPNVKDIHFVRSGILWMQKRAA
jgi:hypothetical protein